MELDLKSEHLCAVYKALDCKALETVVGRFENNSIAPRLAKAPTGQLANASCFHLGPRTANMARASNKNNVD